MTRHQNENSKEFLYFESFRRGFQLHRFSVKTFLLRNEIEILRNAGNERTRVHQLHFRCQRLAFPRGLHLSPHPLSTQVHTEPKSKQSAPFLVLSFFFAAAFSRPALAFGSSFYFSRNRKHVNSKKVVKEFVAGREEYLFILDSSEKCSS